MTTAAPPRTILPPWPLAGAVMLACAIGATVAPLLTYTVTLAVLGGAHVFAELRFVEARFAARLHTRMLWGLGVLLAAVVGLRIARNLGVFGGSPSTQVELMVVAGLGALTLPTLAKVGPRALAVGVLVVGVVGAGLLIAPIWTMLGLACLHNWTPVGFLTDGLPKRDRRQGLVLGIVAFVAVPAIIATGLPTGALAAVGAWLPNLSVLPAGELSDHFSAYLHRSTHGASWAPAVFSALVFTQCMHYGSVLGVLPRIAPGGPSAPTAVGLSRIPTRAFVVAIGVVSAVGLVGYAADFTVARKWYGLVAAVHAWVEVPVLLLALAPMVSRPTDVAAP